MSAKAHAPMQSERRLTKRGRRPVGWQLMPALGRASDSHMVVPDLPHHLPGAPEGPGFEADSLPSMTEPIRMHEVVANPFTERISMAVPTGLSADLSRASQQMGGVTGSGRPYDSRRVVSLLRSLAVDATETPDEQQANLDKLIEAIDERLSDEMRIFLRG